MKSCKKIKTEFSCFYLMVLLQLAKISRQLEMYLSFIQEMFVYSRGQNTITVGLFNNRNVFMSLLTNPHTIKVISYNSCLGSK
jgi:hypothetical protein